MANERFLTFDEAAAQLGVDEDELLNLVAANEIRAYRIDREMKFKEADVAALRKRLGGAAEKEPEPAAPPPSEEAVDFEELPEDIVLVEEEGEATKIAASAEMEEAFEAPSTVEIPEGATIVEEAIPSVVKEEETLALVEEEATGEATETVPEVEEELAIEEPSESEEITIHEEAVSEGVSGTTTEIVEESAEAEPTVIEERVEEEAASEAEEGEKTVMVEEAALEAAAAEEAAAAARPSGRGISRRGGVSARVSARRPTMLQKAPPSRGSPVMVGILVLTFLIMIYPLLMFWTVIWKGETNLRGVRATGLGEQGGVLFELGELFIPDMLKKFTTMGSTEQDRPARWWGWPKRSVRAGGELPAELAAPPAPSAPAAEETPAQPPAAPAAAESQTEAPAEGSE